MNSYEDGREWAADRERGRERKKGGVNVSRQIKPRGYLRRWNIVEWNRCWEINQGKWKSREQKFRKGKMVMQR